MSTLLVIKNVRFFWAGSRHEGLIIASKLIITEFWFFPPDNHFVGTGTRSSNRSMFDNSWILRDVLWRGKSIAFAILWKRNANMELAAYSIIQCNNSKTFAMFPNLSQITSTTQFSKYLLYSR